MRRRKIWCSNAFRCFKHQTLAGSEVHSNSSPTTTRTLNHSRSFPQEIAVILLRCKSTKRPCSTFPVSHSYHCSFLPGKALIFHLHPRSEVHPPTAALGMGGNHVKIEGEAHCLPFCLDLAVVCLLSRKRPSLHLYICISVSS